MNRRAFLTRIAGMTAAAVVAPTAVLDAMKPAAKAAAPVPDVAWPLHAFAPFGKLDGTLDLGIIRETETLGGTNDFQIFYESFEGIVATGMVSEHVVLAPVRRHVGRH